MTNRAIKIKRNKITRNKRIKSKIKSKYLMKWFYQRNTSCVGSADPHLENLQKNEIAMSLKNE